VTTFDQGPGALMRRARGGAAKYARMTAQDAAELGAVFWQVARRQATDAAVGLGGRTRRRLRRALRSRGTRR
jgi:hypothetical protein